MQIDWLPTITIWTMSFFQRLKQHYSDGQVLELGLMIGQFIGFGRLLAVLDLEPKFCAVDGAGD
jgi:hypothetical protein